MQSFKYSIELKIFPECQTCIHRFKRLVLEENCYESSLHNRGMSHYSLKNRKLIRRTCMNHKG